MISNYLTLLKLQIYNTFGINRLRYESNNEEKRKVVIIGIMATAIIGVMIAFCISFCYGIAEMGAGDILPPIMIALSFSISFILTFLKGNNILFGMKDYDMVMSLPVNSFIVILSKITMVYFMNFFIGLIALIPAIIIYLIYVQCSLSVLIMLTIALFISPLLPMVLALTINALIMSISVRTKYSNVISLLLSIIAVLAIVLFSVQIESRGNKVIVDVGTALSDLAKNTYLPSKWLTIALEKLDWLNYLLFVGVSILFTLIFVMLCARFYIRINTKISSHSSTNSYQIEKLRNYEPLMAMVQKEWKRYISCTIYALNSTIGLVMLLVLSIVLVFANPILWEESYKIVEPLKVLRQNAPFISALMITMSSTTSASLSLEGKSRWIMCSFPVNSQMIFDSKIVFNLLLSLPVSILTGILISISLKFSILEMVFMFSIPIIYAVFTSILGMYLNVKFPKYDWTSEYYAVKGGALSVIISLGIGIFSSVIPLVLNILIPDYSYYIGTIFGGVVVIVTISLYSKLKKIPLYS